MITFRYDSDFDGNSPYYVIRSGSNLLVIVNPACTDHLAPWVRETLINELIALAQTEPTPNNVVHLADLIDRRNAAAACPPSTSVAVATDRL